MDMIRFMQARKTYALLEMTLPDLSLEQAIERIEEYLREYPDYAQAHNDLGVLQHQRGDRLQALARYERAVRLDPSNQTSRKNLAAFYYKELNWIDDAIALYSTLLREAPEDTEILEALALISREQGQLEQARMFLKELYSLDPAHPVAADVLAEMAEPAVPEPVSRMVSVTVPPPAPPAPATDVEALLADLHQSLVGIPPASKPSETVAEPPVPENWLGGKIAEIEAKLCNDPTNALLHNDLGVMYLEKGDVDLALAHHELAYRYAPQNLTLLKNYAGVCAGQQDRIGTAIELLTGALKQNPTDTELLAGLAQISIQVQHPEEAVIFLKRILDYEPWNQEARGLINQLQPSQESDFFLRR